MIKRYLAMLFLVLCSLLLDRTASAQAVFIGDVGEVTISDTVRMERQVGAHGKIIYVFFANDGDTQRGLKLDEVETRQLVEPENAHAFMRKISERIRNNKTANMLQITEAQKLKLDSGADAASFTVYLDGCFVISAMQNIVLQGKHEEKRITFYCAAGDVQYWRPLVNTILNRIKVQ